MKNHTETPKETETDVKKLAEKLEEIDSAEGIFGEVITDEELDFVAGGGRPSSPANNSSNKSIMIRSESTNLFQPIK